MLSTYEVRPNLVLRANTNRHKVTDGVTALIYIGNHTYLPVSKLKREPPLEACEAFSSKPGVPGSPG